MICKDCEMWVNDNVYPASHEEALKSGCGFCILQDLYTFKEPDDECDDKEFLVRMGWI